ncbi:MAG: hypothetical protein IJ139_04655 [Bacteroidaceae bacterium]|nr:hypothetical protein [Bacteroidaceae bacterium]MBQ9176139.1 hypothetical protein [Bacteroidaceae bacterium]
MNKSLANTLRAMALMTVMQIPTASTCLMAQGTTTFSSTTTNSDGTVTFRYENDKAHEVMVDVQFAGRKAMQKDAQTGLWTVTLGPATPDIYPYCFVVDGLSVMDPKAEGYFPNEGFKNSLLRVNPKSGTLISDARNVPHGRVEYVSYQSKSLGGVNNAIVYLPPRYDKDIDKRYPVFYLLSGTTDTEEVYYKVGRMNYILDNLLAEGKAQEMIIVLPYGNPTKLLPPRQPQGGMMGGMGMMMRDVVGDDLMGDLMPYVDSHYRTLADRDHRAIGGFSRGGNQGLGIGLRNLDHFSYLCSYSSFTATNIPGVYDNATDTNSRIHLFWLGVGTDDFLYGNARDYMAHLDSHGIRSVKEFTTDKFGHTWMNARYFLDCTLRLLFNPEASEAAMKAGKPAPAATGQEPQFTAGVMAQLFPRQVTSPEFSDGRVTLRINAPSAHEVLLQGEMLKESVAMQRDADGVWSTTLTEGIDDVYKYRFVVDGTPTADPTNMFLAPDLGFKHSILENPANPYYLQNMGDTPMGTVAYIDEGGTMTATYTSVQAAKASKAVTICLVPGATDTAESWFKIAHANLIADKLIHEGKAKPCILTTAKVKGAKELKASDYKTWSERRQALVKLLQSL